MTAQKGLNSDVAKACRKNRVPKRPRAVDIGGLVDRAFHQRINVVENGKRSRITTFEAIYRKLLQQEMLDDARAFKTRLLYEKFAREQTTSPEREIVFIGGLPSLW